MIVVFIKADESRVMTSDTRSELFIVLQRDKLLHTAVLTNRHSILLWCQITPPYPRMEVEAVDQEPMEDKKFSQA